MTIILSCITREYIVQVSDRRISIPQVKSLPDGRLVREYITCDDDTNKAVWWNGSIALSYTGLAFIAGMKTDLWLAQTLAKYPTFQKGIDGLKNESTSYFKKYEPYNPLQGYLAFVGIGWSEIQSELHGLPYIFIVSNFHDENCKPIMYQQNEFTISSVTIREGQPLLLHVVGQPLLKDEYFGLMRQIHLAMKKHASAALICELLANTIRIVADRNNTVGKNIMAISLPKRKPTNIDLPDSQKAIFYPFAIPSKDYASFYYMPENRESIEYGPITIRYGTYLTDYKHEVRNGEEIISVIPFIVKDK